MRHFTFRGSNLRLTTLRIFAGVLGTLLLAPSPAHATNPWGRTIGEAIVLRDVTRDMRNRSERLFARSPIAYLATVQNETACRLYEAIQCGAPGHHVSRLLEEFQVVQSRLNQSICFDRIAANDHGLRTYRRLVEDRFLDLTRDLERCHCSTPRVLQSSPYSTYRFDEQLFFEQSFVNEHSVPWEPRGLLPRIILPRTLRPAQDGLGEAVEF
jgi:hypothetical protein